MLLADVFNSLEEVGIVLDLLSVTYAAGITLIENVFYHLCGALHLFNCYVKDLLTFGLNVFVSSAGDVRGERVADLTAY